MMKMVTVFTTFIFTNSQVNALWLLDLEEYNEWMNEEDYMIEDEVSSYDDDCNPTMH